jgi:hypothetical protein
MSFEITGIVTKIYDIEAKSATFQTREFVISTEETYPQFVKFQTVQDRCAIIDGHKEGDKIKVYFDLRGREWQGKYFTNLNAWKVEKVGTIENTAKANNDDPGFPPSNFPPFEDSFSSSSKFGNTGGNSLDDFGDLPF